jgi:hypothetical protein
LKKQPQPNKYYIRNTALILANQGGIKANSITMTGNNLGFGVRNKGTMAANTLLTMTSNGSLINEGAITGKGIATQIVSAGEMKNKGSINSSALATQVTTLNTLTNGTITSDKTLNVSAAGNLVNTGRINGTKALTNHPRRYQYHLWFNEALLMEWSPPISCATVGR